MPLAFFLIFGGALLAYMGWKNVSFQGLLNDTLNPISSSTQNESDFSGGPLPAGSGPLAQSANTIGAGILSGISGAGSLVNASTYFKNWKVGRTDQGVDLTTTPGTPLPAIGTSRVVGIKPGWYGNQPYVWLQALDGPLKGRFYYYAEQITNIAPIGSVIQNGGTVANYAASGTGVEAGLATASGSTLAKATTGYTEGQVTPAGSLFKQLLGL